MHGPHGIDMVVETMPLAEAQSFAFRAYILLLREANWLTIAI